MIKIDRGDPPAVLVAHAGTWTAEYATWTAMPRPRPRAPARYRDPQIKESLLLSAHGKCSYCESEVTATYWGDVEHLLPRAHRPDLVVEWTNLAFVCAICNNTKSDYYEPIEPLLNPYHDEPSDSIEFAGPICISRRGSPTGRRTIERLGLNRDELHNRRRDLLLTLKGLIEAWAMALPTMPVTADTFRREALRFIEPEAEYSAACRDFLRLHTDWL